MRRRSLITFVILNVIVSLGVAFAVISAFGPQNQGSSSPAVITVPVLITATIDPDAAERVRIVTATPLPGQPASVALPEGLLDDTDLTAVTIPTIDPEIIGASVSLQGTATALPQNCILHTVKEGDTPFGVAEQYGADGFALMEVNGLDEAAASNLQIGDTLIVPLEGCALTPADVVEVLGGDEEGDAGEDAEAATEEEDETVEGTPRPTLTLPPTAVNAQVEILQVVDAGDVTAEGVEIQNGGATVNVAGWTLSDGDGNTYTFDEQLLFSQARVTIYTRAGQNTPVSLFWGLDEAVWESGDVVTLADDGGAAQSTFRVP